MSKQVRIMSRRVILLTITLIATVTALAQTSNQGATIDELQRQLNEMRSQMV